ncbi:hypothetical protein E3E35_01715 [Thermococcus sp. GR7]|uniref:hypothetical protein n=1 Tax=unclassified Thermococcus TaxID=2627626 RepID=UPI00142F4704|nr:MULTISPECIES: hypothetical protein [unclassified Thermococcus]NJE46147.1 hypothetical protein [Thermococcus sp. GR7]NJE78217.1 hypothetical protein [Thermococcus sp. GR4]NJF22344.1 hypothetical protein [Thermococcus sp. GR5]
MKKLIAFILTILLLTPLVSEVNAAGNSQPLFKIEIMIRVSPVVINGSSTWMGQFRIYATLKDPGYRAYFDHLAANNTTKANEEFRSFVKQLIYDNLKNNFKDRFEAKGINSTIYLPSGGPVKVLDNWSAVVTFALSNFLVSDGKIISCPLSGPMDFVFKGHVFDYSWDKLTVVLPKDYEVRNLAPAPDDFSNNVAVWTNGDFIPLIELYTPVYSYVIFLNSTRKEISLQYDPHEGYVQFNATFTGANATPVVIDQLLSSFKATMDIISLDTREENGTLVVIGVAKPKVAYRETSSEKIWEALLKLPGSFDRVSVVGGTYNMAPDNTIVITVTEKKTSRLPYIWAGLILVVVLGIFWIKRRGTSSEEPEQPTGEESGAVEDGSTENEKVEESSDETSEPGGE